MTILCARAERGTVASYCIERKKKNANLARSQAQDTLRCGSIPITRAHSPRTKCTSHQILRFYQPGNTHLFWSSMLQLPTPLPLRQASKTASSKIVESPVIEAD